jgi:hypothetical protein
MKVVILLVLSIICHESLFAQWAIPPNLRAENTLDRLSDKGGLSNSDMLYGIPLPPGSVMGDFYFDKKWNNATILLYQTETMIEGYPVKYDIKGDVIEIKSSAGIKILDTRKVKNMVWIDSLTLKPHYFANGAEYKIEGVVANGLLEVLVDGKTPLMKRDQIFVKDPTYNVAMGAGSRDTKIYHKLTYYTGNGSELTKVKGKKEVLALTNNPTAVEDYIKQNKIKLNKESGLISVIQYINTLQ